MMKKTWIALVILAAAVPLAANEFDLPPGKWWENQRVIDFVEITGEQQEQIGDLGLTTGANAVIEALDRLGDVKKISVLTPYQPIGDENVVKFFSESGYDIGEVYGLRCENTTDAIAGTPFSDVFEAVQKIDRGDVDAIVQVGTNLSTSDVFPTIEKMLGKPVVPINIATAWHALRDCGVDDRFDGMGRLFEEF